MMGIATYSFLRPAAGPARRLLLKEFYVASAARRQGVGRSLMSTVIEIAKTATVSASSGISRPTM